MDVGAKIKEARLSKGWTQAELAERMGYTSRSTINKIEKGVNDITLTTMAQFAYVLDVPIDYLFDWYGEYDEISFDELQLILKYRELSPAVQRRIVVMMNKEANDVPAKE